ncbi:MAG: HIT domain-containing protein [Puniceicoccales bacterium]|jgi:histidine triad (HIT) family protein|nr:HIT domain-containing protein [Puniceicoccales bacterium]
MPVFAFRNAAMEGETFFDMIVSGEVSVEILLENEYAVVVSDINPQAPTHVLIIPKKKVERISEASSDDAYMLGQLLLTAKEFSEMRELSGFRLVINNGRQAGETIPYLHVHLLSGRPMAWPPG